MSCLITCWHFSVELSVFWGYCWDSCAKNFMLPFDGSKWSGRLFFCNWKLFSRRAPLPFHCTRVENSEKYICTYRKCCMSPSYVWIQVHIKISISFQDTVTCIILMSSWNFSISSLHVYDILTNHRLLSLEIFVRL